MSDSSALHANLLSHLGVCLAAKSAWLLRLHYIPYNFLSPDTDVYHTGLVIV